MSGASVTAEPPAQGAPPEKEPNRWRKWVVTGGFLAPAVVFLGVWVVYPAVRTTIRSFFDRNGDEWVWFENYETIFTTDLLVTAIRNNAIWIAVVPALVTAIGLIFAVLTEKIRWSVAFKTAVFMPMAISLFASGIIWRVMLQKDPEIGAVNAVIAAIDGAFAPGVLSSAQPATENMSEVGGAIVLDDPLAPGDVAPLGLTGIPPDEVPESAVQAVLPEPLQGGITGVVWRDFRPGGGEPGVVEPEEFGIPGATVELRNTQGDKVGATTAADDGTFAFDELDPGEYIAAVGSDTFAEPFEGVSWLGPDLILPSMFIAYIWIWAGFSMVILAAGLAAIPRDLLEAARTDGGNEWQVFRRVTVPLLGPVLAVVLITMVINVLKVFDIILSLAPGSVQDEANVIALSMWRTSFQVRDFGLGSAIAVFLFVLVIPILALNVRRFKREA